MRDIHDYQQRLDSSLKRLDTISNKTNKKFIEEFVRTCELEDMAKCRIGKYVYLLCKISGIFGKDFDKVERRDIENFLLTVQQNKEYSEWTKHDYKITLKKFYRFMKKEELVSWIKTTIKRNKDENLPKEVYTIEDIEKLIEVADNPRDKAFISLLYESGARISELLNIKLKDIKFEQDYALINIMGKTGNREIPISKSIPLLKTWINYHDKNKDSYLFELGYRGLPKLLRKLFKRAEIDKPFNPHQFRHSRATELAQNLTEAQMKQFFGWTQASDMASVYVHLSGRDLIPKLITQNKTRKCLKCGFDNPFDLKFCSKCLMPLDSKQYEKKVEKLEYEEAYKYVLENDNAMKEMIFRKMDLYLKNKHRIQPSI